MINAIRMCLFVVLVSVVISSEAQTPSEQVIRDDLETLLVPYLMERLSESSENRGASEDDDQATAERTTSVLIDCLMKELEVLALSNNIEPALFMDAMAFAIHWKSDRIFIDQMAGSDQLSKGAEACFAGILASEGLDGDAS